MATENAKYNTRIQLKHDTEANWLKAINFIPKAGEMIIYDADDANPVRIKVGDGTTKVNDLPFYEQFVEEKIKENQADMSQNDETAADYVKNRTHWVETKETTFINNESYVATDLLEMGLPTLVLSTVLELVDGSTYTVTLNNVEYQATCRSYNESLGIGNLEIIGAPSDGIDTECPFVIANMEEAGVEISLMLISPDAVTIGDTITLNIIGDIKLVHQIDKKYLPIDIIGVKGTGSNAEIFNDYSNNTADGSYAHAEGEKTHADGDDSHAEGLETTASGIASHAEGGMTIASEYYSHAEGETTVANGYASHSEGRDTIASGRFQHVQGQFNIEDATSKYAHIVGNGDFDTRRSNAHTLDWSGNAWFAGEVKVGGTGQDDAEAKTLATTEYIDNKFSASNLNTLTVGNATSADTADKVAQSLKIGEKTYDGSSHVEISAGDLGLESAIRFVGVTTTAITDGGTQSPVIDGETHVPIRGDVVINSNTDQEFIWMGSAWEEMGNSSSHALKTISISAGSGLTGGGTLEANRTISHGNTSDQASVSANGRRYITGVTLDDYGHVTGLTTDTETVTDTHYTTGLTAGASGTTTNAATSNPYVKVKDNSTHRAQIQLKGSGATNVSSDANGVITFTSTDTDTGATAVTVTGTGNAVTSASYDASTRTLTLTKGASYTANTGDITGVTAGNGLTDGGTSGTVTLNVGAGTGIVVNANDVALATSGVTAGTYGPSANVSGTNGTTLTVPEITVDSYGRVTGVTNRTYTSVNTDSGDTKVTQAAAITTNGAYPVLLGYSTATTAVTNTVNKSSKMTFNPSTGQLAISGAASTSTATGALKVTGGVGVSGSIYAGSVYGAVWNDYAEYREGTAQFEPGRVICENGDDTLSLATERLQPGANVVSDTFGFAIGETEQAKTPIAVSGRVLVYPYEDRNSYNPGDAVCAAPNGTVSKMTREEIREYPERIIGTVSAIPSYETWGEGNVPVNGRIWIKIK